MEHIVIICLQILTNRNSSALSCLAVREDFMSTQAFSDIYMELVQDADKASAFFNGIVPKEKNKASVALPARS